MPLVQVRFKVCPTFTIWKIQPVCIVSDRWHLTSFQEQSVSKRLLVKLTKMACNCSNTNIVHEKKHVASYASVCQPTAIPRCSVYNLAISCFLNVWIQAMYKVDNARFILRHSTIFSCNMSSSSLHTSLNRMITVH